MITDAGTAKRAAHTESNSTRGWLVHIARCLLLVAIVLAIHWQHRRARSLTLSREAVPSLGSVQKIFPDAAAVAESAEETWEVSSANGAVLGSVIQTSPAASDVIGFSGPTNILLGFSEPERCWGSPSCPAKTRAIMWSPFAVIAGSSRHGMV